MVRLPLAFYWFDELESTQIYAKNHLEHFLHDELSCVIARYQTKGLGTAGRSWHSPLDQCLTATFIFFSEIPSSVQHQIAEIASISVSRVLKKYQLHPTIKWPNDVLVNDKKIAGILVTLSNPAVLIGIGLNLSLSDEDLKAIDQPATSLWKEINKQPPLREVLYLIAEELKTTLDQFWKEGFLHFFEEYDQLMVYKGCPITYIAEGEKRKGRVQSFCPSGTLLVQSSDNKIVEITSGHIDIFT